MLKSIIVIVKQQRSLNVLDAEERSKNLIRPRQINLWNSGPCPRHLIVARINCFLLHFPALLVFILSTHTLFISQDISQNIF